MPRKLDDITPAVTEPRALRRRAAAPPAVMSDRDKELRRATRAKFARKVRTDVEWWYGKMRELVEKPGSRDDLPKAQFLGRMLDRMMPTMKEAEKPAAPPLSLTINNAGGLTRMRSEPSGETIEVG